MSDLLVERLTFEVSKTDIAPIPFPAGQEPVPQACTASPPDPLPKADVVVIAWTAAEAQALAAVLTPGHQTDTWIKYAKDFAAYEPHLTWKSPAKESKCLALYWPITVGSTRVLCMKSDLHLATDDNTAPVIELWKQIVREADPKLIVTCGTAGGIGADIEVGDVLLTNTGRFDCTRAFKAQAWGQKSYAGPLVPTTLDLSLWPALVAANADKLAPQTTRSLVLHDTGDVLTCDAFHIDDAENHYGLRTYDPSAVVEEMDDMTLPLALEEMGSTVAWLVARVASDPQMPQMSGVEAESRAAAVIYQEYGFAATIGAVLAAWCAIPKGTA